MARLDDLLDMREVLLDTLEEVPADKRTVVVTELRKVVAEIEAVSVKPGAKEADPIDEIAARRAARGGATSRLGQASGR